MKVLVVGSGGREHAIAWKMAQSREVTKVYVAPGNAGTFLEHRVENVPISTTDLQGLLNFAKKEEVGLTIVGPEAPLVAGITNVFRKAGMTCFGPTSDAAQLEGSKAFAKEFLERHKIPSAAFGTFEDVESAKAYICKQGFPIVIKADGLAAGKGVIIARSHEEAYKTVSSMLSGVAFGEAGKRVVVEEFLQGEEASFIVMTDGLHVLPLATSQDHKARDDGDKGPNTGGMGAYSPAPVITPELHARVMREVIEPTIAGMASEGRPYAGFLYAGLMISPSGQAKVLEFNCRCGDPETQPILLRLTSDLSELCLAALDGTLHKIQPTWDDRTALGVVMAAGGYPEQYRKGDVITGLPNREEDFKVFHAGTALRKGQVVTNGGRVLCVTGLGTSVTAAQKKAYDVVEQIRWDGVYYRRDIGYQAVAREMRTVNVKS
jgi:phosphoribosylamine--glycine ligase